MNYAETSGFAGTVDWAQLDLQIIQLRDYFGHLSIFTHENFKKRVTKVAHNRPKPFFHSPAQPTAHSSAQN